jgi:hypothetical protein
VNPLGPAKYALYSSMLSLAVVMGLLPLGFLFGTSVVLWSALGFWMMSLVGVVGGAWEVDRHGSGGKDFPMAVATCILARLLVVAVGAGAAATRSMEAVYACLVGLGASYFPMQAFEMNWFLKRNKLQS